MTYIIILVVIAFILWKGKPYLMGLIIKYREGKKVIQTVKEDYIYVPIRSSRTFNFTIEIDELGEGKASISVVKTK